MGHAYFGPPKFGQCCPFPTYYFPISMTSFPPLLTHYFVSVLTPFFGTCPRGPNVGVPFSSGTPIFGTLRNSHAISRMTNIGMGFWPLTGPIKRCKSILVRILKFSDFFFWGSDLTPCGQKIGCGFFDHPRGAYTYKFPQNFPTRAIFRGGGGTQKYTKNLFHQKKFFFENSSPLLVEKCGFYNFSPIQLAPNFPPPQNVSGCYVALKHIFSGL